jgi:hypothetical protein
MRRPRDGYVLWSDLRQLLCLLALQNCIGTQPHRDVPGGRQRLRGALASGEAVRIGLDTVQLNNAGDTIRVQDANSHVVDQVAYTGNDVRPRRSICFGRQPG